VPIDDVAGAVEYPIQQGKVRHFGLPKAGDPSCSCGSAGRCSAERVFAAVVARAEAPPQRIAAGM